MKIYGRGQLLADLHQGDAALVEAGDVHSVRNEGELDAVLLVVTVPPLEKTR
jgi:quercetin dioxygenase-like cupin family protein